MCMLDDSERIAVLRIELRDIDGMKEILALVLHHKNRNAGNFAILPP